MAPLVGGVAVNVRHGAVPLLAHLDELALPVHVSLEAPIVLGTAGAIGNLAAWLDGRSVLVVNADMYTTADLGAFVGEWDRTRACVLTDTPGDFGPRSAVVASIVPGAVAAGIAAAPAGLWEVLWSPELEAGRLQTVHTDAAAIDCGTPVRYLEANLMWLRAGGRAAGAESSWFGRDSIVTGDIRYSVVGSGARVDGTTRGCVVWPGAEVKSTEVLSNAVRTPFRTVLVRPQFRLRGARTGVARWPARN